MEFLSMSPGAYVLAAALNSLIVGAGFGYHLGNMGF